MVGVSSLVNKSEFYRVELVVPHECVPGVTRSTRSTTFHLVCVLGCASTSFIGNPDLFTTPFIFIHVFLYMPITPFLLSMKDIGTFSLPNYLLGYLGSEHSCTCTSPHLRFSIKSFSLTILIFVSHLQ